MTEQDQNIAIAKACGWRCLAGHDLVPPGLEFVSENTCELPSYTSSLDACHEAEAMALIGHHQWMFNAEMFKVAAGVNLSSGVNRPEAIFKVIHATAAQRCEALLKTLNLWKP